MTLCWTANSDISSRLTIERLGERHDRAGVDGLRHHQAGDEADGVEEGAKKHEIGYESHTEIAMIRPMVMSSALAIGITVRPCVADLCPIAALYRVRPDWADYRARRVPANLSDGFEAALICP